MSQKLFTNLLEYLIKSINIESLGININGVNLTDTDLRMTIVLLADYICHIAITTRTAKCSSPEAELKWTYRKHNWCVLRWQFVQTTSYTHLIYKIPIKTGNQEQEVMRRIGLTCTAFGNLRYIYSKWKARISTNVFCLSLFMAVRRWSQHNKSSWKSVAYG